MKQTLRFVLILLVVFGLWLQPGCTTTNTTQSVPTDTESEVPQGEHSAAREEVEATPTETPPTQAPETQTPVVEETEPVVEDAPLSEEGPWMFYTSFDGLYISNLDGSGVTMLHPLQVVDPYVVGTLNLAAPQGGRVAVLELIHMEDTALLFPNLKVIKVPSGEVELDLPLLPEEWGSIDINEYSSGSGSEQEEIEARVQLEQIFAAAGVWNNIAWSHDGEMLAFNAAIDGPSTDLYVYHTSDGSIVRLTDGPSQSVDPVFSPDDRFILHGAVGSLNWGFSGAGYDNLNVWAARADDSGVTKVYDKEFYGFEHVLGWTSDTEYIAVSSNLWCGWSDVRIVDLMDGVQETVFTDAHDKSVFAPDWNQILLYGSDDLALADCEVEVRSGVYLLDITSGGLLEIFGIDQNQITDIFWHPQAEVFFVSTERDVFYAVGPAGGVTEYQAPAIQMWDPPLVSPDGTHWVFMKNSDNLVAIGDNQGGYMEFEITEPGSPVWTNDSTMVIFAGEVDGDRILFGISTADSQLEVINPDGWPPLYPEFVIENP